MATVKAPNETYAGTGPGDAVFIDGVAEDVTDEAALNYYRDAGYDVDGETRTVEPALQVDSRSVDVEQVGTTLRDAAIDPHDDDFLPPIGAGHGDPHGATVVAPQIHASGPAGIRPGEVFVEDVEKQAEREADFVEARIIDQIPAPEVVKDTIDTTDRGDLGLSDPGSAEAGRVAAEAVAAQDDSDGPPPRSGRGSGLDAWRAYAARQGVGVDDDAKREDVIAELDQAGVPVGSDSES